MEEVFKVLRAAAVQSAPVVLDKKKTLDRVDSIVDEAADQGANLILFPEAYVCCYPTSQLFGPVFGGFSDPAAAPIFRRFAAAAIEVPARKPTGSVKPQNARGLKLLKDFISKYKRTYVW